MLQNSHVWTEDNHAEAVEMWAEGRSMSEIADHFCISRGAVSGYVSRNRDVFAKRVMGRPAAPKVRASGRVHAIWTDQRLDTAERMWKTGQSAEHIAASLGVTTGAFQATMKRFRARFPYKRQRGQSSREVPANLDKLFTDKKTSSLYDGSQYQLADREPIAFAALTAKECVFPVSTADDPPGPEMPCCGAPVAYGPYCSAHAAICWRGRG